MEHSLDCGQEQSVLTERANIVWLWLNGMTARDISAKSRASVSTVYRWIRRWQEEGTVATRPYRRHPQTSSSRKYHRSPLNHHYHYNCYYYDHHHQQRLAMINIQTLSYLRHLSMINANVCLL